MFEWSACAVTAEVAVAVAVVVVVVVIVVVVVWCRSGERLPGGSAGGGEGGTSTSHGGR